MIVVANGSRAKLQVSPELILVALPLGCGVARRCLDPARRLCAAWTRCLRMPDDWRANLNASNLKVWELNGSSDRISTFLGTNARGAVAESQSKTCKATIARDRISITNLHKCLWKLTPRKTCRAMIAKDRISTFLRSSRQRCLCQGLPTQAATASAVRQRCFPR